MNLDDMKQDWRERNNEMADKRFDDLAANVVERAARDWRSLPAAVALEGMLVLGVLGARLQRDLDGSMDVGDNRE